MRGLEADNKGTRWRPLMRLAVAFHCGSLLRPVMVIPEQGGGWPEKKGWQPCTKGCSQGEAEAVLAVLMDKGKGDGGHLHGTRMSKRQQPQA